MLLLYVIQKNVGVENSSGWLGLFSYVISLGLVLKFFLPENHLLGNFLWGFSKHKKHGNFGAFCFSISQSNTNFKVQIVNNCALFRIVQRFLENTVATKKRLITLKDSSRKWSVY